MSIQALIQELKILDLPIGQFAIHGSGPIGIRGGREIGDLDLVVTDGLWEKLKEKYSYKSGSDNILVLSENVEAFNEVQVGPNAQSIIDDADIIDGIRFAKLEHIRLWKEGMRRPKDIHDIEIIDGLLKQS